MDISEIVEITRFNRQLFTNFVKELSDEQINKIPQNCNNNIAWNYGHIVISQQSLCYLRSEIEPRIDPVLIPPYIRGSKPEGFINREEINQLAKLSDSLLDTFLEDYKQGYFKNFKPFTTLTGATFNTIEKAFTYSGTHDFLHFGVAMGLKKWV